MIPASVDAERDLLSAMMLSVDAVTTGLTLVDASDFYSPENGAIFATIRVLHSGGQAVDATTVMSALGEAVPRTRILEMMGNPPIVRHAPDYARVISKHSAARRVLALCAETTAALYELVDPYELVDELTTELGAIDTPAGEKQEATTIDELLLVAETSSPWVVEGMLRSDWRMLLVAGEGEGKSVILRQVAMLASQGLHPFKFTAIPPVRALIVDLENPAASIVETGAKMAHRLRTHFGTAYDSRRCRILRRPGGIDPRGRHDRGVLEREIRLQKPDLVCIGPAYKIIHRRQGRSGVEGHEEATEPVLDVFDDLRTRYGFAMMIEHHAAKGFAGKRDLTPYGSQRWMAWPEIGLSLRRDKSTQNSWDLERYRGDRLASDWPDRLNHGDVWPWMGTWSHRQPDLLEQPF